MGNGKERKRNSCLPFLLNRDFYAARFVLVEVGIAHASCMFPGEKDCRKSGP